MTKTLTLGPILFNWLPDAWRDFYFKIADEAPVDEVYIGEVVCSKRQPFFEEHFPDVIERLENAGKKVIFSSLAMVMNNRESKLTKELCAQDDYIVEANDISAHSLLTSKPHVIGPFINLYNEETLQKLNHENATRFCLPHELSETAISLLAKKAKKLKSETEVQVFGRIPLAVSSRCYHARMHNLSKDSCQFVCNKDPDGHDLKTIDQENFLTINGIQTMSYSYLDLLAELKPLSKSGVTHFRLSPHSQHMVEVAKIFDKVLKEKLKPTEGQKRLKKLLPNVEFSNGFYHGISGHMWDAA